MFKGSFLNIVLYIYIKYLLFYVLMMFNNDNYALISFYALKTFQDVFYYLFIFLVLPTLFTIFFSIPIQQIVKLKNKYVFGVLMAVIFSLEYFAYTYLASQLDYSNGIYLIIISVAVFVAMFYKTIALKLKPSRFT